MAIVDLVRVVGNVAKSKYAVRAVDIWDGSSDREVRLGDHIHRRIVRNGSKEVCEVIVSQILNIVGADICVKVAWLIIGPMVQILLEK